MNTIKYMSAVLVCTLVTACFDDKGNYDYDESIADVNVRLEKSYGVKKEKVPFSYTITPTIRIHEDYKKNLSFEWYMNTLSAGQKGDLVSTDETLTVELDPTSGDMPEKMYIRLYTTDNITGAVNMSSTTLEVVNPYTFAWMVLHETDNHAELGAVEYMGGSMIVTLDAYTREYGESMKGKPLSLFSHQSSSFSSYGWPSVAQSHLYLTTTEPDESGIINTANDFRLIGKWTDILHSQQYAAYYEPVNSTLSGGNYGAVLNSKGRVFLSGSGYSPVMYLMHQGDDVQGEYYISKMAIGPQAGVGFDETGHRFLNISCQNSDYWFSPVADVEPKNAGPVTLIPYNKENAYDPSRIPEDQKIVAIVNGYHYGKSGIAPWQRYTIYGYTISGLRSYVYVFQCRGLTSTEQPALPYYYEFSTPDGVDEHTPMTSGNSFNNILFYAVKNKIYRLDVSSGNSTLIYQHDNPDAEITDLRMACEGYSFDDSEDEVGTEEYGMPYNRCLGAAFNLPDHTGEFVVLQLSTSGHVSEDDGKYPSIQVHRGFGPIKAIAFI